VNARVSDAADWIDEMVCKHSAYPPADFCCHGSCRLRRLRHLARLVAGWIAAAVVAGLCGTLGWHGRCPPLSCCRRCWSRWVVYGRTTTEQEKLMPLKTDSSLSSSSSSSDSSSIELPADGADESFGGGAGAVEAGTVDGARDGDGRSYGSVGHARAP
jgi:hypothetical protein